MLLYLIKKAEANVEPNTISKNVDALPLQAIRRYSMGSFLLNVVNDGIIG